MRLDEAATMLAGLKAAFPTVALNEAQTELLCREMALLHDPSILAEAVANIVRSEDRFPPIARIRSAYRSVAERRELERRALEAAHPAADTGVPVWVQVWEWHRRRTLLERQKANTTTNHPAEDRPPVKMRPFPQYADHDPEHALSWAEYHALEEEWRTEGSPSVSAEEVLSG